MIANRSSFLLGNTAEMHPNIKPVLRRRSAGVRKARHRRYICHILMLYNIIIITRRSTRPFPGRSTAGGGGLTPDAVAPGLSAY